MSTPLVSIIIPTFNRANIINDTLNSILDQTYSNWECLLVDDGSTDETKRVIQNYSLKDARIIALERPQEKNKGANASRNYGLSFAKGDYVIFFDSDDIMSKTCLEKRVKLFSENNDRDFLVFSMGVFKDSKKCEIQLSRKVVNLDLESTLEDFILSDKLPWNVCRPIFKTKLIKDKISFNEKIQNFQDEEFNIRLLGFLKPSYLSIDITDCFYRFDEASLNKYNTLKGKQDIVNCFYEFYKTVFKVLSTEQKVKYKRRLMLKFFNHIYFYLIPGIDKKEVLSTIKLFHSELELSLKEKIIFEIVVFLNLHYHNKKGYYFITQQLRSFLK